MLEIPKMLDVLEKLNIQTIHISEFQGLNRHLRATGETREIEDVGKTRDIKKLATRDIAELKKSDI